MTAYCNFCVPPKSFRDSKTRDEHIKREHTGLDAEAVEYLVRERGVPVEKIAKHFGVRTKDVSNKLSIRLSDIFGDRKSE